MQSTLHEETNTHLRGKKTIGILAMVLGALRFISGINTFSQIDEIEKNIDGYGTIVDENVHNLVNSLKNYIVFARTIFPIELIVLFCIFVLGIALLCADKEIPSEMPRPKSRRICVTILIFVVIYVVLEIIAYIAMPSSILSEISPVRMLGSIGFPVTLLSFCITGLKNNNAVTTTSPLSSQEHAILKQIQTEEQLKAAANKSLLDAEIEELKQKIEKHKLEKEWLEIEKAKQAELEALKKQLAEME